MAFWIILLVVFAVVIGNIMLVKHTAHMKMPSRKQRHSDERDDKDDQL
ncbi:DUF2897 family protein [Pseudidiomarina insulisalsae]|uniref:DUF2897 domain-containing protein n=1 Tax=Pseudidiomarina insulisalsae TaxID=575789 RepID=A0A432YML3_9GAMM|nr:DUF2897 family protein [Pseudidiomarina insulisalsae]RUO62172.1 DUF2897 domain-containing protein [Pseudidiomarina insulisalsae]